MAKIIKVRENTLSFVKYLPPNVELISRLSMFLLNMQSTHCIIHHKDAVYKLHSLLFHTDSNAKHAYCNHDE